MSSANDEPTPEQRIEQLKNYVYKLEQRIEHLNNYVYELETAAAADREELLEANRIIEVRTNTLKEIAHAVGVDENGFETMSAIEEMKNEMAWIGKYKEAFNDLGMLLFSNDDDDDDEPKMTDDEPKMTVDGNYIPGKIIAAVEKLLKAKASQPSSSGMSSQMFKL